MLLCISCMFCIIARRTAAFGSTGMTAFAWGGGGVGVGIGDGAYSGGVGCIRNLVAVHTPVAVRNRPVM